MAAQAIPLDPAAGRRLVADVLVVWDGEVDGRARGLAIGLRSSNKLEFHLLQIEVCGVDETTDAVTRERVRGGEVRYGIVGDPAARWITAWVELGSGVVEPFETPDDDPVVVRLREALDGEVLDLMHDWRLAARRTPHRRLQRELPEEWEGDELLGWDEIDRDARWEQIVHEGRTFNVMDLHCARLDCPCAESEVWFHRDELRDGDRKEMEIGKVRVPFDAGEAIDLRARHDEDAELLAALWETYVRRWPRVRAVLAERTARMKAAVGEAIEEEEDELGGEIEDEEEDGGEDEGAVVMPFVRAQEKIGRNAACPCGSGKKYKRCCGRG